MPPRNFVRVENAHWTTIENSVHYPLGQSDSVQKQTGSWQTNRLLNTIRASVKIETKPVGLSFRCLSSELDTLWRIRLPISIHDHPTMYLRHQMLVFNNCLLYSEGNIRIGQCFNNHNIVNLLTNNYTKEQWWLSEWTIEGRSLLLTSE